MNLQGKIIALLPQREGATERGAWRCQDFVIETTGDYARRCCFTVFGAERLERFALAVGQCVRVFFDIDAREHNGRWYNSITAYDVRLSHGGADEGVVAETAPVADGPVAGDDHSGLPF